ncbi:MAG: hypothetical protein GPJ17_19950 [Microcystis aeruginosa K13-07]|nr:hypothetical protein [Microcystis aeruginosa K13-07]
MPPTVKKKAIAPSCEEKSDRPLTDQDKPQSPPTVKKKAIAIKKIIG